jgi:protein TonB
MFKVLNGQKRRVISPTTVVASIAAHVLLLGGAVYAAAHDTRPPREVITGELVFPTPLPTEPPPPVDPVEPTPPPPTPAPVDPSEPAPVEGTRVDLETPTEPPIGIIAEPPGLDPVDPRDHGDGITGDVIGTPPAVPTPRSGNTTPPPAEVYVLPAEAAEVRPELNRDGLARTMERYYPAIMRDSRVTGRVVVEVIVEENGRVREGSARIVETTHPAFGEATLRAVERFRFRPARMGGTPVPVRVTIPINWTVPQ